MFILCRTVDIGWLGGAVVSTSPDSKRVLCLSALGHIISDFPEFIGCFGARKNIRHPPSDDQARFDQTPTCVPAALNSLLMIQSHLRGRLCSLCGSFLSVSSCDLK